MDPKKATSEKKHIGKIATKTKRHIGKIATKTKDGEILIVGSASRQNSGNIEDAQSLR